MTPNPNPNPSPLGGDANQPHDPAVEVAKACARKKREAKTSGVRSAQQSAAKMMPYVTLLWRHTE